MNRLQLSAGVTQDISTAESPTVSCDLQYYSMGMRTTIYGYIEEMDFWKDPIRKQVRKHNFHVIRSLPEDDNWPPLSKGMFAISSNRKNSPGPNIEYFSRIIHFGANLKSVERDWQEWKAKFEILLINLYFLDAKVHFKTEYSPLETSEWRIDLSKYHVIHDNRMPRQVTTAEWDYKSSYE